MFSQLTLPLQLSVSATFANVIGQQVIKDRLHAALRAQEFQCIYFWGGSYSGKTHLLQAACHEASEQHKRSVYIPLSEYRLLEPHLLHDLECLDLVCVDDVQQLAREPVWQEALFYLYNRLQALQHRLMVTGNCPPGQLPLELADLTSRLGGGEVYQMARLSDQEISQLLQQYAQAKSIHLSQEVLQFILTHQARDLTTLLKLFDQVAILSLAEKRRITIPFIRQVLDSKF